MPRRCIPSVPTLPEIPSLQTRNLFEVAVLLCAGHRLEKAERVDNKVVCSFSDPTARQTLTQHRNGELSAKTRDLVNAINTAREIAFGT